MSGISKRVSGSWVSGDYGIMKTATDTITTLPADIYADGNNATVSVSGNMEQNGTPTPQNPIQPSECGDLETIGEKAGQYKIPILCGNQTTNIYLGETQSTRRIQKVVFKGNEEIYQYDYSDTKGISIINILDTSYNRALGLCTHYQVKQATTATTHCVWLGVNNRTCYFVSILDDLGLTTVNQFKSWLTTQYNAGTPVTVYYVMATPETTTINEPLMKIGDYADEVSGISIPAIAGGDSFDVLTTLKPSEVELTYTGWHDASVKEWDGSQWNE